MVYDRRVLRILGVGRKNLNAEKHPETVTDNGTFSDPGRTANRIHRVMLNGSGWTAVTPALSMDGDCGAAFRIVFADR